MRTRFIVSLLLASLPVAAVIVDRTAITVGNKVITDSEIIRRLRLSAFQNTETPEYSLDARREAAQRLIDLKLVEHEMDLGHYARTTPDRSKALLDSFTAEHFQSDPDALRKALANLDLTPDDLQMEFAEQEDLLSFTSLRFRPAVEISDSEIEEYYRNHVQTGAANTSVPSISLADSRPKIEQILANERADLDLDAWLRDQRTRTKIVYLEKDLQ
jgi:hypothetical protein